MEGKNWSQEHICFCVQLFWVKSCHLLNKEANIKALEVTWKIQCKPTEDEMSHGLNQQEVSISLEFPHKMIENALCSYSPLLPI